MAGLRERAAWLGEFDLLVLASLIWFLGQFSRYVFPPLFETLGRTYGASNTTLGLLFSLLMFAYATAQFPSGLVADRAGPARVVAAGVLVLSGGAFLLFGLRGVPALLVAVVLMGAGSGVHKTVAIALLSAVYPGRTGRVLGTMDAVGQLGGVAAPAAVVFLLSVALHWSLVFAAVGLAGLALAAGFRARSRRRPVDRNRGEKGDARAYLSAFLDGRFVAFVAVAVSFSFAWNGLAAFLPLYLSTEKGLSVETAGLLYGILFLASVVQPVTGALSDRVGRLPVMAGALLLAGGSLFLVVAAGSTPVLFGLVPLVGVGVHGFRPVRDSYLVSVIPGDVVGGTLGLVRTAMIVAASAAPALVGYLSDVSTFAVAFSVLAGALGTGAGITLLLLARGVTPSRGPRGL